MSKDLWKLGNKYDVGDLVYAYETPCLVVGLVAKNDGYGVLKYSYQVSAIRSFDMSKPLIDRITISPLKELPEYKLEPLSRARKTALAKTLAEINTIQKQLRELEQKHAAIKALPES